MIFGIVYVIVGLLFVALFLYLEIGNHSLRQRENGIVEIVLGLFMFFMGSRSIARANYWKRQGN